MVVLVLAYIDNFRLKSVGKKIFLAVYVMSVLGALTDISVSHN